MAVKVNPSDEEMVTSRAEAKAETYWFKAKKASVIPARRRLVKRMVFDCLVQFLASLCSNSHKPKV
uniref:Uncharacterized protein n=1 Tax=Citrus limon TaxID=2708 RepID=A0A1S8ACY7_CITLI